MDATYDPETVEGRWYGQWERSGAFRPETHPDGKPFTIVIPPPNVTGVLHMGHALDLSIQDAIIRRRRMQGFAALWLPGTDHAGIATQMVVERELAAEGLSRHDLGREAFVEQAWAWKRQAGGRITTQMRALGLSCDWSRERFTLDEGLSRAVQYVFVQLYEDGLIYRGSRIINWSPGLQTAISDIEVEYKDVDGELVHILYPFVDGPLADGTAGISVATTRAETMLGDTAVAVHPDDLRYREAVGKLVRLPLMNREIPVVADDAVEQDFGTGAVKVTPAHDPLDFEIGQRHALDAVVVIGEDARMTDAAGPFAGLDRFEARIAVKEALAAEGTLIGVEPYRHSVGHCSRSGVVVEPLLSAQWFVSVGELVGPAIEAVRNGETRFVPKRWEKNYFHWMENLRDWCVSRQLWWGHRIPAWYCDADDTVIVALEEPTACPGCGSAQLRAEEDVLDTWFSSALWPFSTLGWPEMTDDLARFYPTDVLVTGFDIIYFWVARMMKMGLRFTDQAPFEDVVIHGLVRAADGRKMSKSIGNAIDPLDLVERYGADPLRLSLLQAAAPGHDIPFNEEWVDAARRFGNKLWNATRFATNHLANGEVPASGGYPSDPSPVDRWILSRLHDVGGQVDSLLEQYRISDAVSALYTFAWSEAFDWFLEMAKPALQAGGSRAEQTKATLGVVLRDILKYFHPIVPFITEELWSQLVGDGLIIVSDWPAPPPYPAPAAMETFQDLIGRIRRFRAEHEISPRHPLSVTIDDPDGVVSAWWHDQAAFLAAVDLNIIGVPEDVSGLARLVSGSVQAFIPFEGLIDVEAECARLTKRLGEAQAELAQSQKKLANPQFRDRAPAEVVEKEQRKVNEATDLVSKIETQMSELGC
ncbi:MAG: valine--tRNA ligase [Acidimicrobiia bacterium]|nr:valine--tRNA ligase [Acidimicrobiia bacterium]